jgi:hypothetical protein
MMAKRRREKKNEEEEFLEKKKKEEEGNITIALFSLGRGTNKHILPSFKKVSVFFLFSALCSNREKKEELS